MKLLTKEIRSRLPALYKQDGLGNQAIVHCKFFTPFSSFTWYVMEFDGNDTFFGFVVSDMCPEGELGYFSLRELMAQRFGPVPAVERDLHFTPRTLGEVR